MTDPGRRVDTSPETEAESQEPDDDATLRHTSEEPGPAGGAVQDLTLAGQILSQLKRIAQTAEADRLDARAWRTADLERQWNRDLVTVGLLIAQAATFLVVVALGLAALIVTR